VRFIFTFIGVPPTQITTSTKPQQKNTIF